MSFNLKRNRLVNGPKHVCFGIMYLGHWLEGMINRAPWIFAKLIHLCASLFRGSDISGACDVTKAPYRNNIESAHLHADQHATVE